MKLNNTKFWLDIAAFNHGNVVILI